MLLFKNQKGSKIFGYVTLLLLSVFLQNCAPSGNYEVPSDASGSQDNDQTATDTPIEKIPTKDCILNSTTTYQCVVISYGDHVLQDYELWLPNKPHASGDRPLVVYTHGGGYWKGDRDDAYNKTSGMAEFLELGYAFATTSYRLSGEFPYKKDITGKYPAEMRDVGTALQDLQMRAAHYGYNPNKIALTGVSAGGGISLWLAFHDDLKDLSSASARDHFTTRAKCVALSDTQTTLNIAEVTSLLADTYVLDVGIPGIYGFTPEAYLLNPALYQQEFAASMQEASPISHISADDDVNLLLTYMMDYNSGNIHSPEFGDYFTKGTPATVALDYGRTSLLKLNKPSVLKANQQTKNKTNIINHIKGCF